MSANALEVFESAPGPVFRYYDTPFSISDKTIQAERRQLLDADGVSPRTLRLEVIGGLRACR